MRATKGGVGGWVYEQLVAAAAVFFLGTFPGDKVVPVIWCVACVAVALLHGLILSSNLIRLGVLFSRDTWYRAVPRWADVLCDVAICWGFVWTGHPVVAVLHGLACFLGGWTMSYLVGTRAAMGDDYPKHKAEWEAIKAQAAAARKERS